MTSFETVDDRLPERSVDPKNSFLLSPPPPSRFQILIMSEKSSGSRSIENKLSIEKKKKHVQN